MISCCSDMYRMVNSVAGEIKRLEGIVRGLAVLIDKTNLSGFGMPMHYVAIPAEVLSRINAGCMMDMCDYFVTCVRRILTSSECLQLDGACRACLSLLPSLESEVKIVVERIKSGGKLFDTDGGGGEESGGEILANIVELLESVKLVAAKDVHGLLTNMQMEFRDLDENDLL